MTVGPVQKTGNSSGADQAQSSGGKASTKNMLDYNSFLTLLIAQIKNQDPTEPSDPAQQIAQLASFSQVEQTIQSNAKLDSLLSLSYLQSAQGYVGKYIEAPGNDAPKGMVASVKIYSDGVIATLEDGKQVLMGPGVVVRNEAPADNSGDSGSGDGKSDDGNDEGEKI
ncbi:flagellar hook assembly protein FlgD [Rhizobium laguerreae]|uniref:flagellar hook assembly protein FlgD n=1 Tax=Rhizobium laguerreae TaxID=1076926 RepID=UPI001C90B40F|nr:flagellar hook assembly protein FlgD [Rhizobium laguerreae]MBY3417068.1 flagellar hook assembly protein FlgD [Rhizobium laguerreae]